MWLILPAATFLVLLGLFWAGVTHDSLNRDSRSSLQGQPAPTAANLQPIDGYPSISNEALLQAGKVKLVNFWASWCPPCRAEHPTLMKLAGEGVAIFGINYKDDPGKARAFLDALGNPYTGVGGDPGGRAGINWGVVGLPETFVVDVQGRISTRIAGPVTARVLADRLRPALAKAGGGG